MIDFYHAREVPPWDERTWNLVRSSPPFENRERWGSLKSCDGLGEHQNQRWVSPLGIREGVDRVDDTRLSFP
jgi:hypothetical protein